jgi:stearoyl-CoA desaturase (Delta-9 desaturase)
MTAPAIPSSVGSKRNDDPAVTKGTDWVSAIPFLLLHLAPLAFLFVGITLGDLLLAAALYVTRMFFITAGYHRYFSHRSYRLSRPLQFVMALGGLTAAQKGPLWWAGHHRRHHRGADTPRDVHSPADGLWWSHVGWVLSRRYKATDFEVVPDLERYPELVLLNRYQALGPWVLGALCLIFAGCGGFLAFALSTVLLWHATFAVNSIGHRLGTRRYATRDTSRNLWPLALVTMGEGWHNNHHHHPTAARQGHRWWELDLSYCALRLLSSCRLVRDLRTVPKAALETRRISLDA